MTSLQFLLFALRVTLNVLRFTVLLYFDFIIVIKKITDPPKIVRIFGPPCIFTVSRKKGRTLFCYKLLQI